MHSGIMILAERLVVAMETISQDVKNMSAYVHDISYSVAQFLNNQKEKEDFSNNPFDDGQEASTESEYSPQNQQTGGNSALFVDDLKQEETSTGYDASMCFDHSENSAVFLSEFFNENNGRLHLQGNASSCSSQSSSPSSQPLRVEMEAMNCPEQFLENCSSDHKTLVLQNQPFAAASCSSEDDAMHQEEVAGTYSLTGYVEQAQHPNQSEMQESASPKSCIDERRFKCSHCGKAFKRKETLIYHIRIHTGEKPYKCSQCGKSFTKRSNLTAHMRIHTGELPYTCTVCARRFTFLSQLSYHKRLHAAAS